MEDHNGLPMAPGSPYQWAGAVGGGHFTEETFTIQQSSAHPLFSHLGLHGFQRVSGQGAQQFEAPEQGLSEVHSLLGSHGYVPVPALVHQSVELCGQAQQTPCPDLGVVCGMQACAQGPWKPIRLHWIVSSNLSTRDVSISTNLIVWIVNFLNSLIFVTRRGTLWATQAISFQLSNGFTQLCGWSCLRPANFSVTGSGATCPLELSRLIGSSLRPWWAWLLVTASGPFASFLALGLMPCSVQEKCCPSPTNMWCPIHREGEWASSFPGAKHHKAIPRSS